MFNEQCSVFGVLFGIFFVFVRCLFCSALSVRIESCVLFGVLFGGISRTLFCSVFCSVFCSRTSAVQSPAIPSSPQQFPADPFTCSGTFVNEDVLFGVLFGIEAMFCSVFCSATGVLFGSDVLFGSFVLFGVLFAEKMLCSFSQVCAEQCSCSANGVRVQSW